MAPSPAPISNPYDPPSSPIGGGPGGLRVRITATPPGEAPESVRRAWVGLILPVSPRNRGGRSFRGVGVLTGPKSRLGMLFAILSGKTSRHVGYTVEGRVAIGLLDSHAPSAAEWWRSNAPQAVRPGKSLLFPADVCEEVP